MNNPARDDPETAWRAAADQRPGYATYPPRSDTLSAILKRRYDTGAYGNAHLRMPQAGRDHLARMYAPPSTSLYPWRTNVMDTLMSIPIVVDESIPPDTWRLVDTSTREVLAIGTFSGRPQPPQPKVPWWRRLFRFRSTR